MKSIKFLTGIFLILTSLQIGFAQSTIEPPPRPRPTPPPPVSNPTPKTGNIAPENLAQTIDKTPVSRERREQAYVKLLEAQRHIWSINPPRSQAALTNGSRLARQSLQKAIELDPHLAEAYTALAELITSTSPNELEKAVLLAGIAVKIDAENFGGHRILARLYTIKSRLNGGILEPNFTQRAIAEWKEVARLDPRNAEAFAFLSEFYAKTSKPIEQIGALRKWLSAVAPLPQEARFYQYFFKGQSDLSPEGATIKFGQALLEAGETREAIEILSRAIADNPENEQAIEFLRRAVESADGEAATTAVQSLQQAVYANPENTTLVEILARVLARAGKVDEAAKMLRDSTAKLSGKNKTSAANLQDILGDIYIGTNRLDESIAAYQNALTIRGIGGTEPVADDARDFAIRVFGKIIDAYKKANRLNDAKAVIDRARLTLSKPDLFLRLEAAMLTDGGKVDEAVALIRSLLGKKPPIANASTVKEENDELMSIALEMYDDFSNYLFIADLYSQAKRGKEAVEAVNQAITAAQSTDRKEIARLSLATVQQTAGDFRGAEETLRGILANTPRHPIALNNLGYFLAERGEKLDEAVKLIEQALAIDPNNSSYLDSLGWAYFKLGKLPEAEKYLKDALRIDDSSATVQEHLGDVYQKQGKLDLAKSAWQKALVRASILEEINRLKTKLNVKISN